MPTILRRCARLGRVARATWATGRATWLALAASIDLGDQPIDLVRPGWLDQPGQAAALLGSPWRSRSTWATS